MRDPATMRQWQIATMLQAEKERVRDLVHLGQLSIHARTPVLLDGETIAWITVDRLEESHGLWFSYCGFVHLTRAGRDIVRTPWSPLI